VFTLLLLSSGLGLRSADPADGADPVAAARRLREQAAALAPIPDTGSGITRDVGSIAVIEHDGSNYDAADPDGIPRYTARAPVAQRFYQTHGDNYDFLVVFTNFEFDTHIDGGGSAIAFHNLVRNDVLGTGQAVGDSGALFGSPGRLLGYVDMAAIARYGKAPLNLRPDYPLSTAPGDPGFRDTLNVLAHEVGHQWLAYARFRDASGAVSSDLLDGSRALVQLQRPVRAIRTEFALPPTSDPEFIYGILGGRIDRTSAFTGVIAADGRASIK